METKIGTHVQIRSSFSACKNNYVQSSADMKPAQTKSTNADTFTRSAALPYDYQQAEKDPEQFKLAKEMLKNVKNAIWLEPTHIEKDDYEGRTKFNFDFISIYEEGLNEYIPKRLEEAGVPADITFEFDFDMHSKKAKITQISDEEYREKVEYALSQTIGLPFVACASMVMNGRITSLYYTSIGDSLKRCFEQDISELYIDEKGNIGGANENLKKALEASKNGTEFNPDPKHPFPAKNIEGIIKRLITDENITPNISHMGYDGEQIYTDDGEFKFGKEFDPNLFSDKRYVMRGNMALYFDVYRYDYWLDNEDIFY